MKAVKYIYTVTLLFLCISCRQHPVHSGAGWDVDQLNAEAFDLRYKDIAASKEKSYQALRFIDQYMPDHYDAKARAWNNIAYAFFLNSWFDSTRVYLDKVRNIESDYINKEIEEAVTYITEARMFLRECKYADAFIIYDSTLTIFNGGLNRLKYNDVVPFKEYDHRRYDWAKSDYLLGKAVLGYYYRNTEMPVILKSLDRIESDKRLHIDTTQLSVLYYTYAGAYEKGIPDDLENFYKAFEYIKKGFDLMAEPGSRVDYYLANFYQITGSVMRDRGTREWISGGDSVEMNRYLEDFKMEYLAGKFGWRTHDLRSPDLPLLLLGKADSIFTTYDDPYQHLASGVHLGNYYLRRGDTVTASAYLSRAVASDSLIASRGGFARIWTKRLYNILLQNFSGGAPTGKVREWFDIYSRETDIIAENTRRDYDAQKGKAEAEELVRRSMFFVFLVLSVCVTVLVLLYFLTRQNKKLKKARSELKLQNEELDAQYNTLHFMQKKLIEQKRMELLTYVVRGISHELSQPLGSITQTLYDTFKDIDTLGKEKRSLEDEQYDTLVKNINSDLVTISRSKDAISDLVNSFRNTIRENIIDPEEEFDLARKLDDIVKVIRPTIKSNINLEVGCEEGLVIRSFPLFFSQILTNLISNANQHAFPDSDDPGDTVRITCRASGNDLVIECSDNGIGIPDDELDRLCQPFVSKKQTNLGLGLSLVKNIVEQYMKGEITFSSANGLTATVVIPDCIIMR